MRTLSMAALSLALAFSLTACGDDDDNDDNSSGESTPSTSQSVTDPSEDTDSEEPEQDEAADQAIVDSAILTSADMPSDWESEPADEDEEDTEGQEEIAACMGVDPEEFDTDDVEAESDDFSSPDGLNQVSSQVSLVADEETAINAFDLADRPEFGDCMADSLQDELADDEVEFGEISIDPISFQQFGDETTAFRVNMPMTVQGTSFNAAMDFVLVRVGRGQVMMSGLGLTSPMDSTELAGYTEICVERLQAGLGTA